MQKLGQHWSHRFVVSFDENNGCTIQLPNAICELGAHPERIDVRLTIENGEDQDRLEHVIEEHIERFGFREELQFVWGRLES